MRPSSRDFKLAKIMLNHSLSVHPKEKVLITTSEAGASPLVKAVFIEALKLGAYPVIDTSIDFVLNRSFSHGYAYQFYKHANDWTLNYLPKELLDSKIAWADAYVRIVSISNTRELSQVPPEKILVREKLFRPYLDKIVDKDRWVLTYYPTEGMALEAGVSLDWLLDFYYKSCIVDYVKMEKEMKKLEKILDDGDTVRIVGKDTDLAFSIKGRLAKAATGERNIPDGEVFLAPVHQTVEGTVYFDFPSSHNGAEVSDVHLEFKNGKVVKAKARQGNATLQKTLNSDTGSRSFGELGIGTNYNIKRAMRNTLFDEKIGGTIHLALGRSYREKRGGAPTGYNESATHWDIVKDMRKKESVLYVDGKEIMKDGKFAF